MQPREGLHRGCTMHRDRGARLGAAAVMLLGAMLLARGATPGVAAGAADLQAERASIAAWRGGRAGNLGVRVRDLDNPHRRNFGGLTYFPVSTDWVCNARFERYEPAHHLKIVNILGMEEEAQSPGAVVFRKNGREWRLDAVLENPGDRELFVMFADTTSGRETYGGGRFLYIPLPQGQTALVDFNTAFNPPCALY